MSDRFDADFIVRALSSDARYDATPAVYDAYCEISDRYAALKAEGKDFTTAALTARSEWLAAYLNRKSA